MEKIVIEIAESLDEKIGDVYQALARLKLISKKSEPKLHWVMTTEGKALLTEEMIVAVTDLVKSNLEMHRDKEFQKANPLPARKLCLNCGRSLTANKFGCSEKSGDRLTKWCLDCLQRHNDEQHYG